MKIIFSKEARGRDHLETGVLAIRVFPLTWVLEDKNQGGESPHFLEILGMVEASRA